MNANPLREAVQRYLDLGLRPIRVKPYEKVPSSGKGWQHSEPEPHEFQPGENVGIDLGRSGDLVDVDLDTPYSRALARSQYFFAHLPSFGREGEIPGHRLVRCADAPSKSVKFELAKTPETAAMTALGLMKSVVLELRVAGGQTVFPPSVYVRADGSEQELVWSPGSDIADLPSMTWEELRSRAGLLAFLSLIASVYARIRCARCR